MNGAAAPVGFYGKIPSRGDFVRRGLPRAAAAAWDGWLDATLPEVAALFDGRWIAAWRAARPWRFALAPGLCGGAMTGVWLTSADRAGRPFPLVVATGGAITEIWLDRAEALGLATIAGELGPDDLAERLSHMPEALPGPAAPQAGARWWRSDAPAAHRRFESAGMPDAGMLARMLTP